MDHPWASVYDFFVEREALSRPVGRLLFGTDTGLLYNQLDEIAAVPDGGSILDIPCGGGVALRGLRPEQHVRYVAADIAEAMLERTARVAADRGLAQVEYEIADVGALPFADGEFDLILSFPGPHVFPRPAAALGARGGAGGGGDGGGGRDRLLRGRARGVSAGSRRGACRGRGSRRLARRPSAGGGCWPVGPCAAPRVVANLRHCHERSWSSMRKNVLLVAHRTIVSPTLRDFLNRRRDEMSFTLVVPDAAGALTNAEITAAIDELRSSGLIADVCFGDRDPLFAVADHWDPRRFDAIVISTFAPARSPWLATALPRPNGAPT